MPQNIHAVWSVRPWITNSKYFGTFVWSGLAEAGTARPKPSMIQDPGKCGTWPLCKLLRTLKEASTSLINHVSGSTLSQSKCDRWVPTKSSQRSPSTPGGLNRIRYCAFHAPEIVVFPWQGGNYRHKSHPSPCPSTTRIRQAFDKTRLAQLNPVSGLRERFGRNWNAAMSGRALYCVCSHHHFWFGHSCPQMSPLGRGVGWRGSIVV